LGTDENTIKTHSILVNRDDVQDQILGTIANGKSSPTLLSTENQAFLGNRKNRQSIDEVIPTRKKGVPKWRRRQDFHDDSSVENTKASTSFPDQLQQVRPLRRSGNI